MLDVEPLILDELQRLSALDTKVSGDWDAILERGAPRRRGRRTLTWSAVAVVLATAVVVPALAFSGTVRTFVGLGHNAPRFDQARLRVEVKVKDSYVYRLWTSPSTQGGECMFTTYDFVPAPSSPKKITGGGFCGEAGGLAPKKRVLWSLGTALGGPFVLDGVVGSGLQVSQMTLRWHGGGAQPITTRDGFFLGTVSVAWNPPFKLLPFDLVATDSRGRTVASYRLPSSFLYIDWKSVKPKLAAYRHAHGCSTTPPVWRCTSR